MKMKKMHLCHLNLKNFTINQKLKKMKNNFIKLLELHIMNLKILSQIGQYPPNQIDKVRMTYLKWSPYHMDLENYLLSSKYGYPKRFQYTWFSLFSLW